MPIIQRSSKAGAPRNNEALTQSGSLPRASFLNRLWKIVNKPAILVLLWLYVAIQLGVTFAALPKRVNRIDFSVYYASATALRQGINPYTADLTPIASQFHLDLGPLVRGDFSPVFLSCFEALTHFNPRTAYWIWFGLNVILLGEALTLLLSELRTGVAALAALMLLYEPLAEHFGYAQSQIVVLLLLVLMLRWLKEGHDALAGIALGVAGALRVFPLVLGGYLLLRKKWRALVPATLVVALASVIAVAVAGFSVCISFLSAALFYTQYEFAGVFKAISLSDFVSRLFWYALGTHLGYIPDLCRRLTGVLADFALLLLTMRATVITDDARVFSLWIVTSILISPIAWVHYMVLMFIPFLQLAHAAQEETCSSRALWAMVISYLLLEVPFYFLHAAGGHNSRLLSIGIGELYFVALALAYLSVYWLAVDSPAPTKDNLRFSSRARWLTPPP